MSESQLNIEEKSKIIEDLTESVEKQYEQIQTPQRKAAVKIQSSLRKTMSDFLKEEEFTEISPVILSPVTIRLQPRRFHYKLLWKKLPANPEHDIP